MGRINNRMDRAKAAATALLTIPGMPFIYYGEEIGMVGFKPDERIRTPMQWSDQLPGGGFSTVEPWQPFQKNLAEVNVAQQNDDPASLLNLYRRLIQLHQQQPALASGNFQPLTSSDRAVAAYLRQIGDELVLVVINLNDQPVSQATVQADLTVVAAGTYRSQPLLGEANLPELTVAAGGKVAPVNLPTLEPLTGYIWKLQLNR